ncbi:MAG: Flp pilus assembly protein CpaB [Chloroflexota bacterium]|nr:Flp pilus assembly protein CpaB [Chloroflexota bacterium]
MRRSGGGRTMLLLGAVLSLLAFVVLYLALQGTRGAPPVVAIPTAVPKQDVVTVARDVKGFTILKAEDLTVTNLPVNQVISPTTEIPQQIIGKMLTRDYAQGTQVNTNDVSDPGVSQVLTKGQRGFVLPIHEVDNFGGQLVDGDVVDVLWTRQFEIVTSIVGPDGKPTQLTRNFPTTKKVLDNIKVVRVIHLAAGGTKKSTNSTVDTTPQQSGSGADTAAQQAAAAQAAQALYGTTAETPFSAALILGITDQQAEVIKYARETGIVNLTLRAQGDTDVERTTGITDKIMTEDYGVVLPEIIFK